MRKDPGAWIGLGESGGDEETAYRPRRGVDCTEVNTPASGARGTMANVTDPARKRHDDIVIQRRFGEHASTRTTRQVYAVTYPDHTDRGLEQSTYADAERVALELAERAGVAAWYEETPNSERRTLLKSFR